MSKKILVSAYFARNFGDDLFLKILFDRYPNVDWDLLTANRNYKDIFKDYKNVKIIYTYREVIWRNRPINIFFTMNDKLLNFKKYDALVHIGGSIFMESPAWKQKFREREYLLTKFKKMSKKVYVIGANFGPYHDVDFKCSYEKIFNQYDDVCFRDSYSYNLFKHLENIRLSPDIVFNLKEPSLIKEKCVGVSVVNIDNVDGLGKYSSQYKEKMIEMVEKYRDLGYKIKLFSFCEGEGDFETALDIIRKLGNVSDVKLLNYEGNIKGFLDEFKSCEVIIGTRLHSIILGFLFNQSVFPILYSEKTYHMLKDLGMDNYSCHIKDIQSLNIKRTIEQSLYNKLNQSNVFSEAEEQFLMFDQLMEKI